jgi:hypothetical protein
MGRSSSIFMAIIQLAPLVMGVTVALFLPMAIASPSAWGVSTVIAFAVGFALFVSAKAPMLRKDRWWSFGPSDMPTTLRTRYWAGYVVMGIAFLMTLALAASLQVR